MGTELVRRRVSRETFEQMEKYVAEFRRWNARINLASKKTLNQIWDRHILDSLQLSDFIHSHISVLDLGSGGGLPGVILAIHDQYQGNGSHFHLVESDNRKCAFLRQVVHVCALENISIHSERIEKCAPLKGDMVVARGLTSLSRLLELAERHSKNGFCIFPKGQNWKNELTEAQKEWDMEYKIHRSVTDSEARLLEIGSFSRV